MRAIQVREVGGPEVLELVEVGEPQPGDGELLVDVGAAGVNYIDTYQRGGIYPLATPFVLGIEGAGTVRAVGAGVDGVAVGDRVAWKDALGSYAEQAVVQASEAVPVPDGVSDEDAAALLLQGMTAHYLATSLYPVQPGDWVVVHAAAGGVGLLLTQMVKMRGGNVLATVSTPEKAELARGAGADEIASYEDFADRARELTGGTGVACVYDGVGKTTFDRGLDALRVRGTMALFGAASGPVPPFDPQQLNAKGGLFLTRPTLGHYTRTREELDARAADLFGWAADGKLDVRIGGRYPLAEARRAHEDLQGRRTTGKLLLVPGE
ncbi:quinone oxidoreductase family protein [Phytoactinopolyspora halotolerans]|uniref:Quinone oxidoreductase n=1 Tax=Phytoactinopolyspora halotolerans TaxID=1981512 RepID=A0A6L9SGW7_9ACTN|nr:quinone oxidoreductase [Phytoactinopolyspora halotolerans]NEE03874.1 quinone oxidoreductase [Phytoactinopolyspora halotolerans]